MFKKTVSSDDIVHFIDEENFLNYVYILSVVLLPTQKVLQNSNRSTKNGETFPGPL